MYIETLNIFKYIYIYKHINLLANIISMNVLIALDKLYNLILDFECLQEKLGQIYCGIRVVCWSMFMVLLSGNSTGIGHFSGSCWRRVFTWATQGHLHTVSERRQVPPGLRQRRGLSSRSKKQEYLLKVWLDSTIVHCFIYIIMNPITHRRTCEFFSFIKEAVKSFISSFWKISSYTIFL